MLCSIGVPAIGLLGSREDWRLDHDPAPGFSSFGMRTLGTLTSFFARRSNFRKGVIVFGFVFGLPFGIC